MVDRAAPVTHRPWPRGPHLALTRPLLGGIDTPSPLLQISFWSVSSPIRSASRMRRSSGERGALLLRASSTVQELVTPSGEARATPTPGSPPPPGGRAPPRPPAGPPPPAPPPPRGVSASPSVREGEDRSRPQRPRHGRYEGTRRLPEGRWDPTKSPRIRISMSTTTPQVSSRIRPSPQLVPQFGDTASTCKVPGGRFF